jgi:hypothetical protein
LAVQSGHAAPARSWRAVATIAAVVIVVGGVLAFFLLRGGHAATHHRAGPSPSDQTPSFAFHVDLAKAVATSPQADAKAEAQTARTSASDVADTLSRMYALAYLDPKNWRGGDYSTVFEFFTGPAAAKAQRDAATLTLGQSAGDSYDTVVPVRKAGRLLVKILMDKGGNPAAATAKARFTAEAIGKDGTVTEIHSTGTYFLRIEKGGWVIYAYRAKQSTKPGAAPQPSATASPTS